MDLSLWQGLLFGVMATGAVGLAYGVKMFRGGSIRTSKSKTQAVRGWEPTINVKPVDLSCNGDVATKPEKPKKDKTNGLTALVNEAEELEEWFAKEA
jgi:hypothetical protein